MKQVFDKPFFTYLKTILPEPDALAQDMRRYAEENHIPIVDDEVAHLLNFLIHLLKPQRVLEIGTAIGYSTIAMAKGLPKNGKILTVELTENRAALAKSFFAKAAVSASIDVQVGDFRTNLFDHLPAEYFDLIFIDAGKGQYRQQIDDYYALLKPNGLIIADNIFIQGWVVDLNYPSHRQKTMVRNMRKLLDDLCNDRRFQCHYIPFGDGVALLRKVDN